MPMPSHARPGSRVRRTTRTQSATSAGARLTSTIATPTGTLATATKKNSCTPATPSRP
jgi:hypothetical protein